MRRASSTSARVRALFLWVQTRQIELAVGKRAYRVVIHGLGGDRDAIDKNIAP